MNSIESHSSSVDPTPSLDKDTSTKKEDKSKSASKHLPFRFLEREVKEAVPKEEKPLFSFDLDSDKKAEEKTPEREDVPEVDGNEVPLEDLSSEEELEAAQMIRTEARDRRANETSEDEADQAINEVLDSYDSKVIEEGKEPAVALTESLEEIGISVMDTDLVALSDEPELAAQENVEQEIDLSKVSNEEEVLLDNANQNEETHETATAVPSVGGSGGGGKPPIKSVGLGGSPPSRPNPWRSSRWNPNVFPAAGSVSSLGSYNQIRRDHRDYWSGFMTGGIVGYFVGHRRGRIKTERKLASVRKKLEKRVDTIDKQLKTHEYTIRKLVKDKVNSPSQKQKEARIVKSPEAVKVPKSLNKETAPAKPVPATEIHLGRLVMTERPKVDRAVKEVVVHEREEKAALKQEKSIAQPVSPETMSNNELLKYSEDIIIDGTSLKNIYETQLIGEKGLRRLVNEYTKGGNLKEALNREILERQIDFERDPAMRDIAISGSASVTGTGQKSLEQMIKKAESALSSSQEEVAFLKAKAVHDSKEQDRQSHQSRAINAVFLGVIASLVIAIILLILLKH